MKTEPSISIFEIFQRFFDLLNMKDIRDNVDHVQVNSNSYTIFGETIYLKSPPSNNWKSEVNKKFSNGLIHLFGRKKTEHLRIKARINSAIRSKGHITTEIAYQIVKSTIHPAKYTRRQVFAWLEFSFPIITFYECKLCQYKSFIRRDEHNHLNNCDNNILKRKSIIVNIWETNKPFSPSKIKPDWWNREREFISDKKSLKGRTP